MCDVAGLEFFDTRSPRYALRATQDALDLQHNNLDYFRAVLEQELLQ